MAMQFGEPLELVAAPHVEPPEATDRVTPWELQVGALLPVPAVAIGVLLAAALTSAAFAARAALGLPFHSVHSEALLDLNPGAQLTVLVAVVFGYVIAAFRHTRAAISAELRRAAEFSPGPMGARADDAHEMKRSLIRRSRRAGALGALLGLIVLVGADHVFSSRPNVAWQPLDPALLAFLVVPLFWVLGRVAYLTVQDAGHAVPVRSAPLDLNDLESLDVYGRIALRLSLAWIVGSALPLALVCLSPSRAALALPIIPVLLGILAVAVVSFVLPVRHVHRRIRAAKQATLTDIRWQISEVSRATVADRGAPGRLTDLISYEKYLVGLREWPFDTSTLVKFGLFLLIPLGSWSGGAFVERFINLWLD